LNVAPEPRDVHDPAAWQDTVLFHPDARAALQQVCAWGLVDASVFTTARVGCTVGGITVNSLFLKTRGCGLITF
jgi:hypothetical protein